MSELDLVAKFFLCSMGMWYLGWMQGCRRGLDGGRNRERAHWFELTKNAGFFLQQIPPEAEVSVTWRGVETHRFTVGMLLDILKILPGGFWDLGGFVFDRREKAKQRKE